MEKTKELKTGTTYRGTIKYNIEEDGTVSQVIKIRENSGLKRSKDIFKTPHGTLKVSAQSLQATFVFNRNEMNMDQIVDALYDESDEIRSFIQNEGYDKIKAAVQELKEQVPEGEPEGKIVLNPGSEEGAEA